MHLLEACFEVEVITMLNSSYSLSSASAQGSLAIRALKATSRATRMICKPKTGDRR